MKMIGEIMVKELVLNNRSCRGYDQKYHFTRKEMEEYIDCARLCPSSGNVQPLKYYIAYEETYVTEIQKLTHWAGLLPKEELPHKGKEPTAFVVICQDMSVNSNLNRFQKDVGIVAQTMLLLATEQGLGGCMIGDFQGGDLKKFLGIDENIQPLLVVALGKPDEKIVLTEVGADGKTAYYRDEKDIHYVPKRAIETELLN